MANKKTSRKTKPRSPALSVASGSPSSFPCPKCGSADIYRLHAEAGEVLDLSYGERSTRRVNEYVHIDGWTEAKVKKECIRHHCRCCQYEWETGVLENTNVQPRGRPLDS
jgi:hypothetical protein